MERTVWQADAECDGMHPDDALALPVVVLSIDTTRRFHYALIIAALNTGSRFAFPVETFVPPPPQGFLPSLSLYGSSRATVLSHVVSYRYVYLEPTTAADSENHLEPNMIYKF